MSGFLKKVVLALIGVFLIKISIADQMRTPRRKHHAAAAVQKIEPDHTTTSNF